MIVCNVKSRIKELNSPEQPRVKTVQLCTTEIWTAEVTHVRYSVVMIHSFNTRLVLV